MGNDDQMFPVEMLKAAEYRGEIPEHWPLYIAVDPALIGPQVPVIVAVEPGTGNLYVL